MNEFPQQADGFGNCVPYRPFQFFGAVVSFIVGDTVKQEITIDVYGTEVATETEREVFCEVDSITQSEFYQAANTELNPEYKFTIFFGDYDGEPLVEFQGVRYAIYRTYRADDNLELYTERKIGA